MVFLSFFIIVILIYLFLGIIKNNNKTIEIQKDIQGKEEENEKRREMLDILDKVKKVDPVYFEKICLDLMRAMGYGDYNTEESAEMTPKSHDGGIDGIINEDALGFDKIYIQAKRYSDTRVCAREMRNFLGALTERQSKKGIFITTGEFDKKAMKNGIKTKYCSY